MPPRIARLSDLEDLLGLVVAFRDHLQRIHPDKTMLREGLRHLVSTSDSEFFLTLDDAGRGVGFIQQRYRYSLWLGSLEACLEDLFVVPSSRRQGVAKSLVAFAIQRANEKGCRSIKLDTNELNLAAVKLYEGLGFSSGSTRYSDSRQLTFEKVLGSTG